MIESPPEGRGIGVEASTYMTCEEQRLHIRHKSERNPLLQIGVLNLVLFPKLPSRDNLFANVVVHPNASPVLLRKARSLYLTPVDERQHQTISQCSAEFLHQIESKTRTPWTVGMEETNCGVKADAFQSRFDVMAQVRIDERQECVDTVQRRPA